MFEVEKKYKKWEIKTDDSLVIVMFSNGIKEHIELLENLIKNNCNEHNHKQYREEIERYKEYLKIL